MVASWVRTAILTTAAVLLPASSGGAPTEPGTLTNLLEPASKCRVCHAFVNSADKDAEPNYSPWAWQGSIMANAARDPVFWAGVAIAHQDSPGTTQECVRCHSPRAFLEGRGDSISMDQLEPDDLDGVSCDLCHRMVDDGVTPPGNAHYTIDDDAQIMTIAKRGPWDYGVDAPEHPWQPDPYMASSRVCGTCHDVTTPRERVDDDGTPMGMPFNEQRTYSEWLASAFAEPGSEFRSCQDCHMPAVADVGGCGDFDVDGKRHAMGARRHDLVGANKFMLELLKQLYGDAGTGDVDDVFYDTSLERLDELITTAATMELEAPGSVDVTQGLDPVTVTITNETGHKLPSGYSEGRVMWIEVVASYADRELWSSGKWEPGVGPQSDAQLRTYEGIAEDYADGTRLHLLRNNHWVVDTRIPPRGLKQNVETDPVGDRYTLQGDGTWPNFDVAAYAFSGLDDVVDATPGDSGDDVLELRVRLLYLINTPEYIEFLADQNSTNGAGTHVKGLFDDAGGATPLVLAERTVMIDLTGLVQGGTTGTGTATGTSAGTGSDGDATTDLTATGDDTAADDDGGGGCGCRRDRRTTPLVLFYLAPFMVRRRRRVSRL